MLTRKSMLALAALTTVAAAALSPTGASAWGGSHGGGFGGFHRGGFGFYHGGYHGDWNHRWGYRGWDWRSRYYGSCCYGFYRSYQSYSPVYSASTYAPPTYSPPSYATPTPTVVVNQKVNVEGNNNSGLPPVGPEGPPPPR